MLPGRRTSSGLGVVVLCLTLLGLHQVGAAALIKAKAWLAPVLIEEAWQQTRFSKGEPVKVTCAW